MFPFEPFKDNKPWRRALSIAFGMAFVIWGVVGIQQGQITALKRYHHTFYAATDPVGFWLIESVIIALGIGCIYRGVRGKR